LFERESSDVGVKKPPERLRDDSTLRGQAHKSPEGSRPERHLAENTRNADLPAARENLVEIEG
jgi:hypothetical protein